MSRKSYGADVFSPVAGNGSFNDDVRNSDSFDLWQEPYSNTKNHFKSEAKEKDPFALYLCKEEVSLVDKVPGSTQSVIQSKSAVEKRSKKSSSEADASRFSYITTRSKGTHQEELGVIQENQSVTVSKTRKKNRLAVQPETDSNKEEAKQTKEPSTSLATSANLNKELSTKEIKQNKNSATVSAISADPNKDLLSNKIKKNTNLSSALTDLNKELFPSKISKKEETFPLSSAKKQPNESSDFNLHIDSVKSNLDNPGLTDKQAETRKMLSKSNMILKKSHSKSKKVEKDSKVITKKNSQIEKPKELPVEKENRGESVMSENLNAEPGPTSSVSKTVQVQANIIEKLVKDAVSFEFDQIRQMLYLHQLQLLRSMDKNVKTIEDLVEENRRLKNIIAHQNT